MSTIKDLQPQAIWKNFYLLTQVPRPSGHLEKVQEFLLNWAKEKGVEAKKDEAGNILMYKPASAGMENCKMVFPQNDEAGNRHFLSVSVDRSVSIETKFERHFNIHREAFSCLDRDGLLCFASSESDAGRYLSLIHI